MNESISLDSLKVLKKATGTEYAVVYDLECDVNFEHGPAAHTVGTKAVLFGWSGIGAHHANGTKVHTSTTCTVFGGTAPGAIVGHNIGFDLAHDIDAGLTLRKRLSGLADGSVVPIDTQDLEYLLTGHQTTWASLDELAERYGFPKKLDVLKNYLDAGKNVSEIPKEELTEYLEQDVRLTAQIADAQLKQVAEGSITLEQLHHMSMKKAVTTLMSVTGLPFDLDSARAYAKVLESELKQLQSDWITHPAKPMWMLRPDHPGRPTQIETWDKALTSPTALCRVLGLWPDFSWTEKECVGNYKNGKPKYKNVKVVRRLVGIARPSEVIESADEAALRRILDDTTKPTMHHAPDAIELVLKYREKSKLLNTYVLPLIELAETSKDGRIHPQLNTAVTATGRLSSSKPNAQNMPSDSPVKSFFTEKGYTCVEGDYKQLEMIALALKTMDRQLLEDLANGVDIHFEVGKEVFGWKVPSDMTKATRRLVKSVDFGLVYGGGAKTLAAQSGADVATVQRVIDAFFKRYPSVLAYHKKMEHMAKDGLLGVATGKILENGTPQRCATLRCAITGRKYSFRTYPSKYSRTAGDSYSPTELKNYFVQGLATADFVPFACAYLAKAMAAAGWFDEDEGGNPKAKLCNTVHDSIMVWVKDEYALEFAEFMKAAMEVAWIEMFKFFKCDDKKRLGTQVVAEISIGPSWGTTKELTFS